MSWKTWGKALLHGEAGYLAKRTFDKPKDWVWINNLKASKRIIDIGTEYIEKVQAKKTWDKGMSMILSIFDSYFMI
jgi:hypothetical protein